MEIKEIQVKSALVKSGIPGVDYVINPYVGCSFACVYCYASFMSRYHGKDIGDWGKFVFPKINAPEILKKELARLKDKGEGKEIFMSSVTDPYQGIEAKYHLTRRCLETIAGSGFRGVVSILTKSDMVTGDIDVLKRLKNALVGLTITSTDDAVSRYFEKFAPPVSKRLAALETLNKHGIKTYAFVGPLFPHYVAQTRELENTLTSIKAAGTTDIFVEHLNLSRYILERLLKELPRENRQVLDKFYSSQTKQYRDELDAIILSLVKKTGLHLLTDMVIFHKEFQQRPNQGNIENILQSAKMLE